MHTGQVDTVNFIHSFTAFFLSTKCLQSSYYMPGIILTTRDMGYTSEQNRASPLPSGVLLWHARTHAHTHTETPPPHTPHTKYFTAYFPRGRAECRQACVFTGPRSFILIKNCLSSPPTYRFGPLYLSFFHLKG